MGLKNDTKTKLRADASIDNGCGKREVAGMETNQNGGGL